MWTGFFSKTLLLLLITICLSHSTQNFQENRQTANIRLKRATSKPGFFKTLFSVAFEQWTDTKNTINKVNTLVNDNFLPENAPLTTTIASPSNVSTTAAPFKITRTEFNRILSRNLKGLVRLFNIELQDALKQSKQNYAEYKKNATIEYSKFL